MKTYKIKYRVHVYSYLWSSQEMYVEANDLKEAKTIADLKINKRCKNAVIDSVREFDCFEYKRKFKIETIDESLIYHFPYNSETFSEDKKTHSKLYISKLKKDYNYKAKHCKPISGASLSYFSENHFPSFSDNIFFLKKDMTVYILGVYCFHPFSERDPDLRGTFNIKSCFDFLTFSKKKGFILYKDCMDTPTPNNNGFDTISSPECMVFTEKYNFGLPVIKNHLYDANEIERFYINFDSKKRIYEIRQVFYIDGEKYDGNLYKHLDYNSGITYFGYIDFKDLIKNNPNDAQIYLERLNYLYEEGAIQKKLLPDLYGIFSSNKTLFKEKTKNFNDNSSFVSEPNKKSRYFSIDFEIRPSIECFAVLYGFAKNKINFFKIINDTLCVNFNVYENQVLSIIFLLNYLTINEKQRLIPLKFKNKKCLDDEFYDSYYFKSLIDPSNNKLNTSLLSVALSKPEKDKILISYEKQKYRVRWLHEYLCFLYVKFLFHDAIFQYSPDFMNGMIYDIYVPSVKLAIEYQGVQHYENLKHYKLSALEVKKRDNEKKMLSEKNDIKLIQWSYKNKITFSNLTNKIKQILKLSNIEYKDTFIPSNELLLSALCFTDAYKSYKYPIKRRASAKKCFSQYKRSGELIKTFYTIEDAVKETGISKKAISKSYLAHKRFKLAGGTMWVKSSTDAVEQNIGQYFFDTVDKQKLEIMCIDQNGEVINVFKNVKEASKETAINSDLIEDALLGIQKRAGDYSWKYKI